MSFSYLFFTTISFAVIVYIQQGVYKIPQKKKYKNRRLIFYFPLFFLNVVCNSGVNNLKRKYCSVQINTKKNMEDM